MRKTGIALILLTSLMLVGCNTKTSEAFWDVDCTHKQVVSLEDRQAKLYEEKNANVEAIIEDYLHPNTKKDKPKDKPTENKPSESKPTENKPTENQPSSGTEEKKEETKTETKKEESKDPPKRKKKKGFFQRLLDAMKAPFRGIGYYKFL